MGEIILENGDLKIDDTNQITLSNNLIVGQNGNLEIKDFNNITIPLDGNGDPVYKIILRTSTSKIMFIGGTSETNNAFIDKYLEPDIASGANKTLQVVSDSLPCILADTKVKTIRGYVKAKDLTRDDILVTLNERTVNIKNIYCSEIKTTENNSPYIIPSHYFSRNYPKKKFMISPLHAVATNRRAGEWFIPKVHGKTLKRMGLGESIKYYHIELPNWYTDHLIIEGETVIESYAKGFHADMDCVCYIKSAKTGYYKRDHDAYKKTLVKFSKRKTGRISNNKIIFE